MTNTAVELEREQHPLNNAPFRWLAGIGAAVLIALLPVNTIQAMRLEAKTAAATDAAINVGDQLTLLRADVARLDLTLRAFVVEKDAASTMRLALLEQRFAAMEKAQER